MNIYMFVESDLEVGEEFISIFYKSLLGKVEKREDEFEVFLTLTFKGFH